MKEIEGRWPATERVYTPDDFAGDGAQHLVSQVHVFESGPDVKMLIHIRGYRDATITVPREDEKVMLQRLFGEVPESGGRAVFQTLLDEHEDSIVKQDAAARTLARRRLLAVLDSLILDLAQQDEAVAIRHVHTNEDEERQRRAASESSDNTDSLAPHH